MVKTIKNHHCDMCGKIVFCTDEEGNTMGGVYPDLGMSYFFNGKTTLLLCLPCNEKAGSIISLIQKIHAIPN